MNVPQPVNPRDFERWYDWILNHMGYVERAVAVRYYNEAYDCDCTSCRYHWEHGMVPTGPLNPSCKLTTTLSGDLLDRVTRYLAG